jgi:hypothetical protein
VLAGLRQAGIPFRDAGSIEAVCRRQVSISLRLRILEIAQEVPRVGALTAGWSARRRKIHRAD